MSISEYDNSSVSSRETSPVRGFDNEKVYQDIGSKPIDAYDALLPKWRAFIRRKIVQRVHEESQTIAKMQDYIRIPWLDTYFVYTSSLGTHTFFMTFLPALFFFGFQETGRGLVIVLALGVYFSSFFKDLICSPRPFAPPVTRLTIGTHHLEYGFPSTHSTNSVSIALFLFGNFYALAANETISIATYNWVIVGLIIYAFSIVFGRIYTAMHSFTDCVAGILLGAGIWWAHSSFPGIPVAIPSSTVIINLGRGLGLGKLTEDWVTQGAWEVPLILIALSLLVVNQHPQPVDDCPCFEDAIAFNSVVLGALIGKWGTTYSGVSQRVPVVMPGSGYHFDSTLGAWIVVERGLEDVLLWWGMAALKMVVGILTIFVWRILAKSMLHIVLPPTYRLFARAIQLPNRRFYTPATDYKNVPSEFMHANGLGGLRPIPSVIDLPGTAGVEVGGIGSGSGYDIQRGGCPTEMKLRNEKVRFESPLAKATAFDDEDGTWKEEEVKHYDADVLTKVIVYAGIGLLACEALPSMFDILGWGVKSWV